MCVLRMAVCVCAMNGYAQCLQHVRVNAQCLLCVLAECVLIAYCVYVRALLCVCARTAMQYVSVVCVTGWLGVHMCGWLCDCTHVCACVCVCFVAGL